MSFRQISLKQKTCINKFLTLYSVSGSSVRPVEFGKRQVPASLWKTSPSIQSPKVEAGMVERTVGLGSGEVDRSLGSAIHQLYVPGKPSASLLL